MSIIAAFLVLLPAFVAAAVAMTQSPQQSFLKVYIPTLFLLPSYYFYDPPALPELDFNQAAMLGLFAVWFVKGAKGWWFSFTDILVFGFALVVGYSEYQNSGYKDAQNIMFANIVSVLCPYIIAKSLIEPFNLRVALAKRIVLSLVAVVFLSLIQFLIGGWSLWHKVLGRFFGGQGWQWVPQYRWGLGRITGPYGHAILAGILFAVGFRLQRWLEWSQQWPKRLKALPWLPLPLALIISLILFAGMFMTLSRGPWIGAFLAVFIVLVGRLKWRFMAVSTLLIATVILVPIVVEQFTSYIEDIRRTADTHTEQTLVYRVDLLNNYISLGEEKLWLGWGRTKWPKVKGQRSVDNHYLLFFLMHGIIAVSLLITLIFLMPIRLFIHDMRLPLAQPSGSGLGFTLASMYIVYGWSIATVFMGEQTLPFFFILVGWSEGYLRYERARRLAQDNNGDTQTDSTTSMMRPRFKRVLQ